MVITVYKKVIYGIETFVCMLGTDQNEVTWFCAMNDVAIWWSRRKDVM